MAQPSERLSRLALCHASFLSSREKILLTDMLGGAGRVLGLRLADMAGLLGRRFFTRTWEPGRLLDLAEKSEKLLTSGSLGCIFYWDQAYPPQLREIYDPPAALFFRGNLPDNAKALIGIVGTRFPTGSAAKAAFSLGFEFGGRGIGVVSGLARGVDREAHEGCVQARGYSAAVLGNGIDLVYPAGSRPTAMAVLRGGGVIFSEYPPGTPPRRHHFPARNRIISGLCRSVVLVQAPERSGALITADYALEQGRDLLVHRAGLAGSAGAGTRKLAEAGAPVIEDGAGVLREWGMEARAADEPRPPGKQTGAGLAELVECEISGACARRSGQTLWRE
jgi:DNA processing protein